LISNLALADRTKSISIAFLHKIPVAHQQTTVPLSKIAEIQLLTPPIAWMILTPDEKWVPLIEKAIRKFDPSLNTVREDDCSLRVPVPKNTADYKDSLLRSAKDIADRMKGQIRTVRGDARTALKKASGALSKDQVRKLEQSIQTITDDFVKQIDATTAQKTKEVQKI
jgi:ribosome recycling factor